MSGQRRDRFDVEAALPLQQVQIQFRDDDRVLFRCAGALDERWCQLSNRPDLLTAGRRARQLGSTGAMTVHPAQVPLLNEAFSPSAEELAQARALVAAFDAASGGGQGAFRHEGRMVDEPVLRHARAVLARAEG